MIKQNHLVLTSEVYFKTFIFTFFLASLLYFNHIDIGFSAEKEEKKQDKITDSIKNSPAVVIDMKKVL